MGAERKIAENSFSSTVNLVAVDMYMHIPENVRDMKILDLEAEHQQQQNCFENEALRLFPLTINIQT